MTVANVAQKKQKTLVRTYLLFCNACNLHSPCKTFYFFCYIYLWVFSNSYEVSKVQNYLVLHCTKGTFMILFYILRKVLSVLAVLLLVQLNFEFNLTPFKYEERMFYRQVNRHCHIMNRLLLDCAFESILLYKKFTR